MNLVELQRRGVVVMDEKKMEKLYKLKEAAESVGDNEASAALRWAIFELENLVGGNRDAG